MERYANSFPTEVKRWADLIMRVDTLPFECVDMLGRGEQCSVHALTPRRDLTQHVASEASGSEASEEETHWTEDYFKMNDVEGAFSDEESDFEYGSEDESDEWTNVESKEDSGSGNQRVTIVTPSPMGSVEVVAKRFEHLDGDVCYVGCDPTTQTQLMLESSSTRYVEWMQAQSRHIQTRVLTEQITDSAACYSGFVSESLAHLLITDLVARGISPHITMAFRALEWNNTGYLVQERISSTLGEVLEADPNLGARELASLYFQTIFTLHMLQQTCSLKHHDLHTDNVFVKVIDESMVWEGQKLKDATHFSYVLGDSVTVYLPNTGYLVKLGDFGEASLNVYGRRIQRLDMETHPKGTGWGTYTSKFEEHEGYDTQVLCGAPPFECDSWRVEDKPTSTFLRHLRRVVQGRKGKLTRSRMRPLPGHVSRVTPFEILRDVFLNTPRPSYDFRTPPPEDGAVVICLGDVGRLSSEPPQPQMPSALPPLATKQSKTQRRKRRRRAAAVVVPDPKKEDDA